MWSRQVLTNDVPVIEYPGACREGGNDVGENWYTQRVLTNHFFDCRVVRLGEEKK